jgi:catechol 2,3-dioxygenase-like lactoylglutathione lyase family enzyme
MPDNVADLVNVRYMVDDVDTAIDFYTKHLGFTLRMSAAPAFADVVRGKLRLLLSGPTSSAGRPMPDGTAPAPGGWNRIHLIVSDIAA